MPRWAEDRPDPEKLKITHIPKKDGGGVFVEVTEHMAMLLINSLTNQIINRSPNAGRLESYDANGEYFSIGVHPERR